jgi:hypothetical protein
MLEHSLFAESPELIHQSPLAIGSIHGKWAQSADLRFEAIWATTVSIAEPVIAAFRSVVGLSR